MPLVIGIAGPPGSGKSSFAAGLATLLGDAAVVDMDDYQRFTEQPLGALGDWVARGADPNEFSLPLLSSHLQALRRGEAIVSPATGLTLRPRKYILFETHFGRAHRATGAAIDHLLWLDVDADVALARNLRAFLRPLLASRRRAGVRWVEEVAWIDDYLAQYLGGVASLVRLQAAQVRPGADLRVTADQALVDVAAHLRRLEPTGHPPVAAKESG